MEKNEPGEIQNSENTKTNTEQTVSNREKSRERLRKNGTTM